MSYFHQQLSKHRTVKEFIDFQSKNVSWCPRGRSETKMKMAVGGHDAEPWNTTTDHWMYQENGKR